MTRQDKLKLAELVAETLLAGQLDKQGVPIIEHCKRVAAKCSHLSEEQQLAAMLHEVLEDGKPLACTLSGAKAIWMNVYSTVESLFGGVVVSLVHSMSRSESYKSYSEYIAEICSRPLVIPVKIADLEDNLDSSRGSIPESLKRRYEKALKYLQLKAGTSLE